MSDPIEALIVRVRAGYVPDKNETNILLRACLRARRGHVLICADLSQVEARWNAWASDDLDALDVFRSKVDPYSVLAGRIWGIDPLEIQAGAKANPPDEVQARRRDTGKKAELGCGYGMGADKFRLTAEKGGLDWSTSDVTPEEVVGVWRDVHRPIVNFWYAIERACKVAARGGRSSAGPYEVAKVGNDVWILLPSGRPLVYRGMRVKGSGRDASLVYQTIKGEEHTYGGKLCENVTQAACRDLLARAMARCEAEGIPIVLHVHDEIVAEVPAEDAEICLGALKEIMLDLPDWAPEFPIKVSGLITERYRKG